MCSFSQVQVLFAMHLILEYKYSMKKLLGVFLIIAICHPAFALGGGNVVTLDKNNIEKPQYELNTQKNSVDGSMLINNSEDLSSLIEQQKEHDIKDWHPWK